MYYFPSEPAYLLVINEQHKLFPEQETMLKAKALPTESFLVPAEGFTLAQIEDWAEALYNHIRTGNAVRVIFASPIPAMMKCLTAKDVAWQVFHNDIRVKKELPGGKIIQTVSPTGWQLV
jgi:hypothetical protein